MLCTNCGTDNPPGSKFCLNCGTALARPCPSCGTALPSHAHFCTECGATISNPTVEAPAPVPLDARATAAPSSAHAGPVAERRLCSVLFVDLVGFTPLAEKRDAEEIRELLSLYFDRAQAIIGHYGGTVEKFIGDAVMAVWGAPVANEDDAERAVRAALDVVAAVGTLGVEAGIPDLAARAGVVTGEVAITIGKVSEGMVLGDTVNAASRVQSVAPAGTVLVDESTWRAASGAIAFSEVGPLTLKGKEETVHAWRALRVVAQRKGVGRSERIEPPFVGRDEQLRLIQDALHATAREQRARLVSVSGIPGIGKSRLVWEFVKYVDGLADTVYWHQGRSPAYGEGITFWALGEMVRMRALINESEDAATSRTKLSATVAEFVTDPEERRWVEPRLAHLLGLTDIPPGDREELFSAWRTFFERIAAVAPTVMVFEDLQWADPGLIDFIESILEWSRNQPIMVITISRPELMDRRPSWGAGQRNFISLHLEPLPEGAMRELLRGFVQGLPDSVTEAVLQRAEGVPLYAVETVRMLVDRGVLLEQDGTYGVAGELSSLEIPETLQALIASRLDALWPTERSIVQDAAVLGTTFSTESLAVLQGGDLAELEAHLRDLVRKEFLTIDTDPRSPERGQFGFVQGLIGEVARATLSRRDRAAKHLLVARHLVAQEDEELTGLVAAHYAEASRAAPDGPEADEIAAGARDWLSRAGQRALSLGSPEQAITFFEQAIELTPAGAERAALLTLAGDSAGRASVNDRAVAHLEEAVSYYRGVGDVAAAGLATALLGSVLMSMQRHAEAAERCETAIEELGPSHEREHVELACQLAATFNQLENSDRALACAETALVLAERLDDTGLVARAMTRRAGALYRLGRHREAVALIRGVAALASAAGSLREEVTAWQQAGVFVLEDDPREAFAASIRAAELAHRGGLRGMEVQNQLNAAETAVYLGWFEDARKVLVGLDAKDLQGYVSMWVGCMEALLAALSGDLPSATQLLESHRDEMTAEFVYSVATYMNALAMVSLAAGDLESAARQAAEAAAPDPLGINTPTALTLQARAALWLGDGEQARTALAGMENFHGRWMAACRQTVAAGIDALEGRGDEAAALYAEAIEALRSLDCTLDLALCELDLVTLLGADHPAAKAGKEARDIFTEIGAVPFLQRLNGHLEPSPEANGPTGADPSA